MRMGLGRTLYLGSTLLLACSALPGSPANAQNEPPPPGPVVLNLDGTPIPHTYTQYFTSFNATTGASYVTFAFRDDQSFLVIDDISVTFAGGPNLLVNGDFELGPLGASAPAGWTYLNPFGVVLGGSVDNSDPHTGSFDYLDGALQAYDSIGQGFTTIPGGTTTSVSG
jgi:hypothetical protein